MEYSETSREWDLVTPLIAKEHQRRGAEIGEESVKCVFRTGCSHYSHKHNCDCQHRISTNMALQQRIVDAGGAQMVPCTPL